MRNTDDVVNLFPHQEQLRVDIGWMLSREFISRNMHFVPPASILTIFFRLLPRNGIKFMNESNQACSQEQINDLEIKITKKLLRMYTGFTQSPSPGDITTDIFGELKKSNIQIIAPRQFRVVCTVC